MAQAFSCPPLLISSVLPKQVRRSSFYDPERGLTCMTGAVTAIMTNPVWVVKVRMFTTRADDPRSYRGLWRVCFHSGCLACP